MRQPRNPFFEFFISKVSTAFNSGECARWPGEGTPQAWPLAVKALPWKPRELLFSGAFGVGEDDRHIHPVDAFGVAFAAIQALQDLHRRFEAGHQRSRNASGICKPRTRYCWSALRPSKDRPRRLSASPRCPIATNRGGFHRQRTEARALRGAPENRRR
jgi:hypothetical protein